MVESMQAVTIRLPINLYEKLRREAFENHTSQNAIIIEELTARYIQRGGKVIHKDGDPLNNDPSNLEIREAQP